MVTSRSGSQVKDLINHALGSALSTAEWQLCENQVRYFTPKVGRFWDGKNTKSGLYIVLAGKARLLDINNNLVETLSAGETFGEFSLFETDLFEAYGIRVGMEGRLCYLPISALAPLMDRYPEMQDHLLQKAKLRNIRIQESVKTAPNDVNARLTSPSEQWLSFTLASK
jgi:signal-transduction protein with cAMP-binding, CBS, and nucleotidyltransferase domain